MRYHKATGATLAVLMDPAIPLRADGALDLCQDCQRRAWYADGYLAMLAQRLLALAESVLRLHRDFLPRLFALRVGRTCSYAGDGLTDRERAVDHAKQHADQCGWTILIQRRANILRITRQS